MDLQDLGEVMVEELFEAFSVFVWNAAVQNAAAQVVSSMLQFQCVLFVRLLVEKTAMRN